MSIFDDIANTAKSLGGAGLAPAGVLLDLATAAFDDEDDDFGDILDDLAGRGKQAIAPLFDEDTITGQAIGNVMHGAIWTLDNVINEPISTLFTQTHHAGATDGLASMFSAEDWKRSYEIAQEQSAGESMATSLFSIDSNLHDTQIDPHDFENPYDEWTHPEVGNEASVLKWSLDIGGGFLLDPFALGGKALGAARQAHKYGKLSAAQRDELGAILNDPTAKASSRLNQWSDFIAGNNKLGRALTAPEILAATPELRRWGTRPQLVSALVHEATKIGDDAARHNAVRDIIAVAGGDTSALAKVESRIAQVPDMADALKNMQRGRVLDLEHLAANPALKHDPAFINFVEGQMGRLTTEKSINKMTEEWANRLNSVLDTQHTLNHIPGVHAEGGRALNRLHQTGALQAPRNVHRKLDSKIDDLENKVVDKWVAKRAARDAEGKSSGLFIQKSLAHMPFAVVKGGLNVTAGMYTKMLPNISDSLRQTHFIGVANLDDWAGATAQLDSMMKISHVLPNERMTLLSKAMLANDEGAKAMAISQVQALSMRSLAAHVAREGGEEIDGDYIETLMQTHWRAHGKNRNQMLGRAYAATKAPEGVVANQMDAMTARTAQAAQDVVAKADSATKVSAKVSDDARWGELRADHILDESGAPVALPLFESQLARAVPLMDMHLAKKLVKRDQAPLSRLSKAWRAESETQRALIEGISKSSGRKAVALQKALDASYKSSEFLIDAGQRMSRFWKMSVLFRLGYPIRVVLDDHWRIWTQMNAGVFYAENGAETARNARYNFVTRKAEGKRTFNLERQRARGLADELDSEQARNYESRLAEFTKVQRSRNGFAGQVTRWQKQIEDGGDAAVLQKKIDDATAKMAEREKTMHFLQEQMGERSPDDIRKELDRSLALLKLGPKGLRPDKRTLGSQDVDLGDGMSVPGSMAADGGGAYRAAASSKQTFDYQQRGVEEMVYGGKMTGAYRTIAPSEGEVYFAAWADSLNHQIANSRVAMHFVKGGTVDDFVAWIKQPEQADLRKRLPHLAHDPEDWGLRVESVVEDYIPNEKVAERLAKGERISEKFLRKETAEIEQRPVHGREVADSTGESSVQLGIGSAITKAFSFLSDVPTDRLSRHPFFNSMYKMHAREMAETLRASGKRQFSSTDLERIARQSRKLALADVKRTLYDMSAHSHAAHVMRFISPFFAAHQEVLMRWWRIVGENPGVARRFQQGFDLPRQAGLVLDENGEPVAPGEAVSPEHKVMIPGLGGEWTISENSYNLILQNGLMNPGVGPLGTVPAEHFAKKYADEENVKRVARMLNPYPAASPLEATFPATFKRFLTTAYGLGFDSDANTIGKREWFDLKSTNFADEITRFKIEQGREPNDAELDKLEEIATRESLVEAGLRFLNNAASPFPARPQSKYSAQMQGFWRLREASREKFPNDWQAGNEWAIEQFKAKYGDSYMPLIASDSNNPAGLTGSGAEVSAQKIYARQLQTVDPRLARAVMGPYATEALSGASEERDPDAVNYFRSTTMTPEGGRFFTTDAPRTAAEQAMASRGWQQYSDLTASLTAAAQQAGLDSYLESDVLVAARKKGLEQLKAENYAFKEDMESFDSGQYDRWLGDMQKLVDDPKLYNDPLREDIKVLESYLQIRAKFTAVFDARLAAGEGGPEAASSEPLRELYTRLVGQLVESNTYFEANIYTGLIDRDPLLMGN